MADVISSVVTITITVDSVGIQVANFGIPLILSANAAFADRIRFYTGTAAVLVDFAATTPEYLMAVKLFGQVKQPAKIAIGKSPSKPTQKYSIVPTVANTTLYKLYINGTAASFTSDADATNDEIVTGLKAAVDALSGLTLTATLVGSVGSKVLTLTGNAAGNWNAVQVDNPAFLGITQDHVDPGLAADLAAIALEDNSWYMILYPYNSKACALIISAYAEANKKLYFAQSSDSNNATLAIGADAATSLMGQAKTSAYKRTIVDYHPSPSDFSDAAWIGRVAPIDPGRETWSLKNLAGVAAVNMTATHTTNVEAKNGNHYQTVGNVAVMRNGMASSGQFVDLTRFLDWLEATMGAGIFSRMAALDKVPFTDEGVSIVEAEIRAALDEGVGRKAISTDTPYVVTAPKVATVSTANKNLRLLPDMKFSFVYSGAIHKVQVNGVVSI